MIPETLPLEPGDIAAVKDTGFWTGVQRRLMVPDTDRYHHLLIGGWVDGQQDWVVYESVNNGVNIGYFKKLYSGEDIEIYRLNRPDARDIGEKAIELVPLYGRTEYDGLLRFKLIGAAVKCFLKQLIFERKLRRICPEELDYVRDKEFICTELAVEPFARLGIQVVPSGIVPLPASIRKACDDGVLTLVWKGEL